MSHGTLKNDLGHEPFTFTEIEFDSCNRHYNTRTKNLIPMSENMADNFFWLFQNSLTSITNYKRAPDGTKTSNLLVDDAIGSVGFVREIIAIENDGDDYVASAYFRKGTGVDTEFQLAFENGTPTILATVTIDWTTNTISSTTADDYGYEYICEGWYRVWLRKRNNVLGNSQVSIYIWPTVTTNQANVEVWGVQLEKAVQTPGHYIKTTGSAKVDGCYPKGENLLRYSEQFDNAVWTKGNSTVTANSVSSPDNETTADTLNRTAIGNHFAYQVYSTTTHANRTYTYGVWLRQGNYSDTVDITIREHTDGTVVGTTSHVLQTRWILVTVTGTFDGSPTADIRVDINPQNDTGSAGDTLYMWGASLAEGQVYKAYQKTEATNIVDGTGGLDNALKCYETYETCQSRVDYVSVCNEIRLCEQIANLPKYNGIQEGPPLLPFMVSSKNNPSFTSTQIIPGNGLSKRGAVSVKYQDGIHHDRGLDPYYSDRTHDTSQGTFFGKLIARNRHYHERIFRVYTGYLHHGEFEIENFERRTYVLDVIEGPNLDGSVTIKAKDFLFISDSSVKIPSATSGILIADQIATDLQFDLILNAGSEYDRIGTVKIGSELISYTNFGHNFLNKSEDMQDPAWAKVGVTSLFSVTAVTNPFGESTSQQFTENTSVSLHNTSQAVTGIVLGDPYTVSVYLQANVAGSGYAYLALASSSVIYFDIKNGDLLIAENGSDYINAKIENIGFPNGSGFNWYRCSVTFLSASVDTASFIVGSSSTGSNTSYTGSGNTQFYMWAATVNSGTKLGNYYFTDTTQFITNDRMIIASTADRGVFNTLAEDHSIDDSVQQCLVYNENVVDIIYDILVNKGGISPDFVPYNNDPSNKNLWDSEKEDWLSAHTFLGVIPEPTKMDELIKELTISAMCNIWVDEIEEKIMLRAIVPQRLNAPVKSLNEDSGILKNSLRITRKERMRRSQVWVIFSKINHAEGDDPDNFNLIYAQADPVTEEVYGSAHIEKIRSRWLSAQNVGQAAQLAGRTLARFLDAPKELKFNLHAKDEDIKVGDLVDMDVPGVPDFYGARAVLTFEILEKRELRASEIFQYTALESRFDGNYGFIGPNTLGDFSSETDENKRKYAFICYNTGEFLDGTPAYKII